MKPKLIFSIIIFFVQILFGQFYFSRYQRGIELYNNGYLIEAYNLFSELKNENSLTNESLSQIYFLLGEIKYKTGELYEASLDFENYIIKFPYDKNYDLALLRQGQIFFHLGNHDKSIQYLTKLINQTPFSKYLGLAHHYLGENFSILKDYDKSEKHFVLAIENEKSNQELDHTLFSLAYLYEKKGLLSNAEKYYTKLIYEYKDSPLSPQALVRIGLIYYLNGKYNDAISKLTDSRVKQLDQTYLSEAYYLLANSFYKQGKFYEASVEFQNVINRYPRSKMVRPSKYGLAWSYYQQKKFEQAHNILLDLASGNDSLAERGNYWVGYISRNQGKFDRAIDEFNNYCKKYTNEEFTYEAKYQIGMIYYELKRYSEAETILLSILEGSINNKLRANINLILGSIALERKNLLLAKNYYESAVSLLDEKDIDYSEALLGLSIANYYLNNSDASILSLKTILTLKNVREKDKVYFYLAENFFARQQYSEALKNYELVIENSESDEIKELSYYGLIYSYFNLKDYVKAIRFAEKFLKDFTYSTRYLEVKLRLADSYYATKNFEKASALYRDYFSDPDAKSSDYVSYQLAQAMYRAGNLDGAIEELNRFLKIFPTSRYVDEVQYLIGWIRFKQGKYEQSITEYQKVISNYQNSPIVPLALYSIGDAFFNLGMYDKAIENYNRVLTEYSQSDFVIDAINGIQYAYLAKGNIEDAAQAITNFVLSNQGNKNLDKLFIKKGDLYLSQRRFQEAIASYREFISAFPNSQLVPLAYYSIAKAFIQLKSYQDALYNLSIIVQNYSSNELVDDVLLEIGNIYRELNQFDRALSSFDELLNKYPTSNLIPETIYWVARTYLDKGDLELAIKFYNRILMEFNKSNFYSRALFDLGKLKINQEPSVAMNYFKEVVELRNDEYGAESQYLIGEILFNQKKYREAISEYLKLKYAYAGHFDWLIKGVFRIAEAYEKLKEMKKAKEFYNEVYKMDPKGELGKEAKKRSGKIR